MTNQHRDVTRRGPRRPGILTPCILSSEEHIRVQNDKSNIRDMSQIQVIALKGLSVLKTTCVDLLVTRGGGRERISLLRTSHVTDTTGWILHAFR